MNRKAGFFIIRYFFLLIILLFIWAFWLSAWLNEYVNQYLISSGESGLIAFLLKNLNLFFFIGIIISTLLVIYVGGE